MFDRQFSPQEITTYEVAREVIGRRIGELLEAQDATTDPRERARLDNACLELTRQRAALKVGSDDARRIVDEAKARHAASQRAAAHG